ncbi:DUF5710 domain-containing protein [Sphingomonas sp. PAMC 26605]|uniref:DUF5710 domain-containing protein n=1 Tax=Sphingomonas sp. PAMC 26605 TaxID=1112214 RepID=UPI00026CD21D|nr:DUF5710 domain-containing protein [Sphingomonas sp. PAMC 26605]
MASTKREYLTVPYDQRHTARAAGARWDATAKAWYIGASADRAALACWLPDASAPELKPREEFMEAMQEHGLLVTDAHPIADGKTHRVPVEGDHGDARGRYSRPSGQYALHLDGHPAGFLKNFRKGTYVAWKSRGFRLPPAEMLALRAEVAQREREHAADRLRAIEAAALRVQQQTATLRPATSVTGYMTLKGISPTIGALTDRGGITTYLPAIDIEGTQWTLQTIRRDGFKLFEEDSRKEGTFHIVGGDLEALERLPLLIMAEGYATAAIVAEAALQPIVAAFDAGNLLPVVQTLHSRFPDKPILIAGDDDRGVELKEGHNPGRDKATAAAAAVRGLAIFPEFAPGEVDRDPKGFTDFNDLATRSVLGHEAVKAQIWAGIKALTRKDTAASGADEGEDKMPNIENSEISVRAGEQPTDRDREMNDAADRASNRIGLATGKSVSLPAGEEPAVRTKTGSAPPSLDAGDVPPAIAARYLIETSRWTGRRDYFESSGAPAAAFHDRGGALVSKSDSPAVIADMVAIAQHRRWETLEVAGSEAFRREAWFRARAAGLEVNGYRPTERDLQDVSRRMGRSDAPRDARPATRPAERAAPRETDPAPREYLSVPFADREAAKQAGAKWDREAKCWYVEGTDTSAVRRWVPSEKQARTEKTIAADPNARAQLRAIEAVVGVTLADNPEAQRRVLEAGRETLAERVSHDKPIRSPQLQPSDRVPATSEPRTPSAPINEPALPQRRPPERTRGR